MNTFHPIESQINLDSLTKTCDVNEKKTQLLAISANRYIAKVIMEVDRELEDHVSSTSLKLQRLII